ncbi:hypothetical protein OG390_38025 [Streptomyces sp. NBC_00996]|nr:hypothetical protein OG390_38025 [Streptomyces sp. NBC_00996]
MSIRRRVGLPPRQRGSLCGETCPDIFELTDSRFAVVGTERTADIRRRYPALRELDPGEIIVVIDRHTLMCAKAFIPDK